MNSLRTQTLRIIALGSLTLANAAQATVWQIEHNVSKLLGAGTHYLDFQLTDGSLLGNGNAWAKISNLSLEGGTLGSAFPPLGTITYGPGNSFTMSDLSDPVAEYGQEFNVTSKRAILSFTLEVGWTSFDAPTPDQFNYLIYNSAFQALPTSGSTGVEFLSYSYRNGAGLELSAGLGGTPAPQVVPEPATLVVFAAGGLLARRRRKAGRPG